MKYAEIKYTLNNILKFATPLITGSILFAFSALINMQLLGKNDKSNLYILAVFAPVYYFLLAFQESFRSATMAIASSYKILNIRNIMEDIIFFAFAISLALIAIYYLAFDWIAVNLHIDPVYKNKFQLFSQKMIWINLVLTENAILNSIVIGIGFYKSAFVFNLLTCLLTTALLVLQLDYLHQGLTSFIFASSITNGLCGLLMLSFLHKKKITLPKSIIKNKVTQFSLYKFLKQTGLPVFLSYVTLFVGLAEFNSILTMYGANVVSGYGFAYRAQIIIILPAIGLGSALAILINNKITGNQARNIFLTILIGMTIAFIAYGLIAALVYYYHANMIKLFILPSSIQQSAINYFQQVSPSYFIFGPMIVFITMLEQLGYGLQVLMFNINYFFWVSAAAKYLMNTETSYEYFYQIISHANLLSIFIIVLFLPVLIKRFK